MDWESHSLLYPLLLNKNIEFGVLYFRVVIAIIDSHGKIKEVLFLYFVGFWLLVVRPIFSDGGGHDPLDHPPKSATGKMGSTWTLFYLFR